MNTRSSLQQSPYWERRYELFAQFDDGIQMDLESLYSVTPETIAMQQASLIQGNAVLDLFCGVGGNSIAFARSGKSVIAVESNTQRIAMAKHNARIYNVESQITFINQTAEQFLCSFDFSSIDVLFLDPPWGGPLYTTKRQFTLNDFSSNVQTTLECAIQTVTEILLKVPKQFDVDTLLSYGRPYRTIPHYTNNQLIFLSIHFYV
jgi:trimethylguanosine synthase